MSDNVVLCNRRPLPAQHPAYSGKRSVLFNSIRLIVTTLQFDAYGKVIATGSAPERGNAGMPGAPVKRHVLGDLPGSINKDMGRHLAAGYFPEIGM